ncbi:Alpha-2-macroglobulin [Rhodovulum sp. PH10]|uniref:alpha-2-macroglobulin family protein n=1 Tax=Rhodovulum sp. PH10 TaxID=1187851 RepID=UPI00027C2CA4|nr:alpha-2-macroglobulin [Rhodovulum sp. PH10]EJW09983.1 Alpha-2-macroglobulin [Rhodovulum sp. PH10]
MLDRLRAGALAVLLALPLAFGATAFIAPVGAAEKAFQRDDLADAAIRLEAQLRRDAGPAGKATPETLRRDAARALSRNDAKTALQALAKLVAVTPDAADGWLRYSRAILDTTAANDRNRWGSLDRAATAAYAGYQRATTPADEASALVLLGRAYGDRNIWRPALDTLRLSLDLQDDPGVRALYEKLRAEHGFRLLDYTVDADTASPRACFQFSEALPARTDFSPYVAVEGQNRPALSVEGSQLCVGGLSHGESYHVTLREGLPSTVRENLATAAEYTLYVRDRKPFVRFSGKAYVLPRTGQQGIPVVSVNTQAVAITVYRIGDRNLIDPLSNDNLERNLDRYTLEQIAETRGQKVWTGDLSVESPLNAEVTTAFPVGEAVKTLEPGVYVMAAEPKGKPDTDYGPVATQWFVVSDLGLSAVSAGDGIHVFVNALASTDPRAGVEVRLVARNNEILATRTTDADGHALFEAGFSRGEAGLAPAVLVAALAGDYAFLSLTAPAFDLTDRGVDGRPAPDGLDAYVVTERGVYRTGETVHATALLRDAKGVAATGVPLTLVFSRPDGVEHRRIVVADQGLGGRTVDLPIVATAPTGTWRLRAFTDPKRPAVGETSFLVEDYVPDRIEFDLKTEAKAISESAPATVTVDGRFLYGAPAADLDLDGEVTVKAVDGRPGFPGYVFGVSEDDEEGAGTTRQPLTDLPATDAKGFAGIEVPLREKPATSRPLEATVAIRMAEAGGRAVERTLTLPVAPSGPAIGIKALFSGDTVGEGETARFDVVVAAPDGSTRAQRGVKWELLKVDTRYQWYRQDGSWSYEPVKTIRRVADGTLDVAADTPGRIAVPVEWGRYRLDVSSAEPGVPGASVAFDAGFFAEASADTPDLLEIAVDKPAYRSGETMTVAVTARTAGRVRLSVLGADKLITTVNRTVEAGVAKLTLPVTAEWGSGAYVVATLLRPLDAQAKRMPGRAVGVQWVSVDRAARTLGVALKTPQVVRPNETLSVPVTVSGLAGKQARIVVAAVDVGILNLTRYEPPAPENWYLGQRRLGAELRDLYGHLIDGMQGTVGAIRTGGDGGGMALQASPPTQPPLALFSGLVPVAPDGTAEVSFDIPAFAGTVRVMAMAWSEAQVGHASADVIVRDPVVLTATLPRFLLSGDESTVALELDNVEGAAGDYWITAEADGPVTLGQSAATVRLSAHRRQGLSIPVKANASGHATVRLAVSGPNGFSLERAFSLTVKPATQILARRTVRPVAPGESLTFGADLLGDLVPGTGALSLSVGPSAALDVAGLLKALDRYPFGCSEQITSRALPLLYANELAADARVARDADADQRVRDAIDRVLARQDSGGAFGLWGTGGGDVWLDAYVTDFLTRARERGFLVPDAAFRLALDRLRNVVANAPELGQGDDDAARGLPYALYVLARNGAAPVGDLRYIADTKLDALATPIAKAQIGAALAMLGDRVRAERVLGAAVKAAAPPPSDGLGAGRPDYGSALRDAAAVVTLVAESRAGADLLAAAQTAVEEARARAVHTSTQENAWMVLAARALAGETKLALTLDGRPVDGALYRSFATDDLDRPMRVENIGDRAVEAVLTVSGAPVVPEPGSAHGFSIERKYFSLEGQPADPSTAIQNQRFVVVLSVTEPQPQFGRVLVVDPLPAGFEIDNPRLVSSGDTGTLSWITGGVAPVNTEFRDDRFSAAFERNAQSPAMFTVAYVVRAVSPGRYVAPQAHVEDMYRPDRFGRTATGTVAVTAARQ